MTGFRPRSSRPTSSTHRPGTSSRAAGLKGQERPELLIGGPPCTPFSKSGFWLEWKRQGLDPDASLLQAYTRVLADAKPRYFVLENVYALTYDNKASRPAFTRLLAELTDAGYAYNWRVLNAADYGVPQARPRLFIVGARKGSKVPGSSGTDARRLLGTPGDGQHRSSSCHNGGGSGWSGHRTGAK